MIDIAFCVEGDRVEGCAGDGQAAGDGSSAGSTRRPEQDVSLVVDARCTSATVATAFPWMARLGGFGIALVIYEHGIEGIGIAERDTSGRTWPIAALFSLSWQHQKLLDDAGPGCAGVERVAGGRFAAVSRHCWRCRPEFTPLICTPFCPFIMFTEAGAILTDGGAMNSGCACMSRAI